MALIVEDGTGVAGAESYASVADATTYHSGYGNPAWALASTAEQEAALRSATAYIDGMYRFRGEQNEYNQALAWPRYGAIVNGFEMSSSAIPAKLVAATCELALRALAESLFADVATQHVESVKVGPIERKLSAPKNGGQKRFAVADALLRDLVRGGNSSVAVVRA